MRWASGAAAEFIVNEGAFDLVPREQTILATTYPRRWFYSPDSREWFLPRDMRRVRWDRGPDDLMVSHPAWTGSRAVRERPAPEGSWATPIFAQRPIAALQRAVDDPAAVAEASAALADAGIEAVWLSHPRDWRPSLEPHVWAPAGRDRRGFGAVLVEGAGGYRADAFVRALKAGDPRVTPSAIRAASARRVAELRRGF